MTLDRWDGFTLHTFSNPIADFHTNMIVSWDFEISLINCLRRHVVVDLEMENLPFHEARGFHAL